MKQTQKIAYMLVGAFCVLIIGSFSIAALGEAGSETDPLVSKSYVEKRLTELEKKVTDQTNTQIQQQMATVKGQLETLIKASGGSASDFTLIQAKNGDIITFGENTQVILRAGLATAIASTGGGIADLTDGKDLKEGSDLTTNHLLLVPKNDGRGVKVLYDSWFMIKGSYQLKSN